MPERTVPGTDLHYQLVLFDEDGRERREQDGTLLSETILEDAAGVTDIFVVSHGWQGDIPEAISQYDGWVGVMGGQEQDRQRMRELVPGFTSLVVAIHWPSLPWGVEAVGAALLGGETDTDEFAAEDDLEPDDFVSLYASRIGDTPQTRAALASIVEAAQQPATAVAAERGDVPAELASAYRTLFEQAGLGSDGALAAPGADHAAFDPKATIAEWSATVDESIEGGALLGLGDDLASVFKRARSAVLGPVRMLSFWKMKKRARIVGETGVHDLLAALQRAAGDARVHLMGHSFGCIVVSAAIAGERRDDAFPSVLPRQVDTVFLVQGAMSLWSYAEQVPFAGPQRGYFHELLPAGRIRGPVVTTRSSFDTAVGRFYPLGARVAGQRLLGGEWPEYGGIGAFGIQGADAVAVDILNPTAGYGFEPADLVNVDASRVICHGSAPAGAHNDISHPEIAHLMWEAVASSHMG